MISLNILFANDDVLTQWVMTEVLTEAGFAVVSACRGDRVVELLGDAPDFDLLLVDLALPASADEMEIGRHWRRMLPGRPVIYTGSSRGSLRQPLLANETFLPAPFTPGTLLRAVDDAIEESCFRTMLPARAPITHHVH